MTQIDAHYVPVHPTRPPECSQDWNVCVGGVCWSCHMTLINMNVTGGFQSEYGSLVMFTKTLPPPPKMEGGGRVTAGLQRDCPYGSKTVPSYAEFKLVTLNLQTNSNSDLSVCLTVCSSAEPSAGSRKFLCESKREKSFALCFNCIY